MDVKSPSLNEFIFNVNKPCVFKDILKFDREINSSHCWSPLYLSKLLKEEKLVFRVGKKQFENFEIQFENQCEYEEATMNEFLEWISSGDENKEISNKKQKLNDSNMGPFEQYNSDEYWAYADYKYMVELLKADSKTIDDSCIDWAQFGFTNRNAKQSTLWIGSKCAYTPCHYDTYGYNLVAQIYGKKRWIMFSRNDTVNMYPSRIPFEESTIYSKINIKSPNLAKYPLFKNVQPYVVDLEPGDVLYVPKHWWHYVENIENSISINTWVELENEDNHSRLKEIISKTILQGIMDSNMIGFKNWINSSENYSSQEDNMSMIKQCLNAIRDSKINIDKLLIEENDQNDVDYAKMVNEHENFSKFIEPISFDDYLKKFATISSTGKENIEQITRQEKDIILELSNAAMQPDVINLIAKNLLQSLTHNS